MTLRRVSPFVCSMLRFAAGHNEPLIGDVLEEFERGRSRWWLWRQILGAFWFGRTLPASERRPSMEMKVVGGIVLVLVSFEAIFVTNVVHWLIFGPPAPDISGYLYVFHLVEEPRAAFGWPSVSPVGLAFAMLTAVTIGYLAERFDREHPVLARSVFAASVLVCAGLNLHLRIGAQFILMMVFVASLLCGGRLAGAARQWQAA